eukprot:tig00020553_g10668.t1
MAAGEEPAWRHILEAPAPRCIRTPPSHRLTDLRSTLVFRVPPRPETPPSSSSSDSGDESGSSSRSSSSSAGENDEPDPALPPPGPPPPPALIWENPPTPRSHEPAPVGCLSRLEQPYAPLGVPDFNIDRLLPRALRAKILGPIARGRAGSPPSRAGRRHGRAAHGLESARDRKGPPPAAVPAARPAAGEEPLPHPQRRGEDGGAPAEREAAFRYTMLLRASAPTSPASHPDASGYHFLRKVWHRSEEVAKRVRAGASRREALAGTAAPRPSSSLEWAALPPAAAAHPEPPAGPSPEPSPSPSPGQRAAGRFARGRGLAVSVGEEGRPAGGVDPSVLPVEPHRVPRGVEKEAAEGAEETAGQRERRKLREEAVREGPAAPRPSLFPHQLAHHLPGGPIDEPPLPAAGGARPSRAAHEPQRGRRWSHDGAHEGYQDFDVVQREMRKRLLVRMERLGVVRADRALRKSLASQLDRGGPPAAAAAPGSAPRPISVLSLASTPGLSPLLPPPRAASPQKGPQPPPSPSPADLDGLGPDRGRGTRAAELRFVERLARAGGPGGTVSRDALFSAVNRTPPADLRASNRLRLLVAALVNELGAQREFAAFAAARGLPFRSGAGEGPPRFSPGPLSPPLGNRPRPHTSLHGHLNVPP